MVKGPLKCQPHAEWAEDHSIYHKLQILCIVPYPHVNNMRKQHSYGHFAAIAWVQIEAGCSESRSQMTFTLLRAEYV